MEQVAIVSREKHNIDRELSDCVAYLEKTGVMVYATRRLEGCAIVWADNAVISRGVEVLRNAGFGAAPLKRTRSVKLGHQSRK
jgi:hypothetical protein